VRLRIPTPSLIVLCGPAGSGKSTFAARHFPPTAIVSSDACRAMIADDERNLAVSREAFELFHLIIDRRLRFGRLAVADSTALRRDARRVLLEIGRRHGVAVIVIVFDVTLERCYHHDTLRERRVGRAVIERHIRLLYDSLRTLPDEGFDQVVILDEVLARQTSVELVPARPQQGTGEGPLPPHRGVRGEPSSPVERREPMVHTVSRWIGGCRLVLVQGDITTQRVDAIVNAANSRLVGGGGVDGAIRKAGGPAIEEECAAIRARQGGCPTGSAVITGAGRLPAKYVIHAVGPIWQGGSHGEADHLAAAYRASLTLAAQHGARTVAFPSISTGVYGYPVERAAAVALRTVVSALEEQAFEEIRFVLFSQKDFDAYAEALQELLPG
jgi:O-acetyl-ADP-ribose deacetylase (regulator of RNase III)/predicted kinase